jgi:hypothetical protein
LNQPYFTTNKNTQPISLNRPRVESRQANNEPFAAQLAELKNNLIKVILFTLTRDGEAEWIDLGRHFDTIWAHTAILVHLSDDHRLYHYAERLRLNLSARHSAVAAAAAAGSLAHQKLSAAYLRIGQLLDAIFPMKAASGGSNTARSITFGLHDDHDNENEADKLLFKPSVRFHQQLEQYHSESIVPDPRIDFYNDKLDPYKSRIRVCIC